MGDYGFEGAGEFGGMDTNFNCLPDFDNRFCPYSKYLPTRREGYTFSEDFCYVPDRTSEGDNLGKEPVCYERDFRECEWFKREQEKNPPKPPRVIRMGEIINNKPKQRKLEKILNIFKKDKS